MEFSHAVWSVTKKIPKGKVATYSGIARIIGRPKAARAVGNALHVNPFAPVVPCHRVVKKSGQIGGFAGGVKKKIKLLKKEKIKVIKGKIVNFSKVLANF